LEEEEILEWEHLTMEFLASQTLAEAVVQQMAPLEFQDRVDQV
jgi:hypothetical protein